MKRLTYYSAFILFTMLSIQGIAQTNEKEFHKTGKAMEENMNFPNATNPATNNVPRRDDRTEQEHHYKNYKSVNPPNQQHHRKFEVVRNGQTTKTSK